MNNKNKFRLYLLLVISGCFNAPGLKAYAKTVVKSVKKETSIEKDVYDNLLGEFQYESKYKLAIANRS